MSLLERLNLPANFGYALLLLGLALSLAPYLRGADFGVVKIPDLSDGTRRALVFIGPLVLAAAVLVHVPVSLRLSPLSPAPLLDGSLTLAPFREDGCLWAVTVTPLQGGMVSVLYPFDRRVELESGRLVGAHRVTSPSAGERVYAELPHGPWVPGTVSREDGGRAFVVLDDPRACGSSQPYVWAKPDGIAKTGKEL